MEITKIKYYPIINSTGRMPLAVCSITFDDVFMVHDIKIFKSDIVVMPKKPNKASQEDSSNKHKSTDLCHPVDKDFFMYIRDEVLIGYELFRKNNVLVYEPSKSVIS